MVPLLRPALTQWMPTMTATDPLTRPSQPTTTTAATVSRSPAGGRCDGGADEPFNHPRRLEAQFGAGLANLRCVGLAVVGLDGTIELANAWGAAPGGVAPWSTNVFDHLAPDHHDRIAAWFRTLGSEWVRQSVGWHWHPDEAFDMRLWASRPDGCILLVVEPDLATASLVTAQLRQLTSELIGERDALVRRVHELEEALATSAPDHPVISSDGGSRP